jgi:hypothetical protein
VTGGPDTAPVAIRAATTADVARLQELEVVAGRQFADVGYAVASVTGRTTRGSASSRSDVELGPELTARREGERWLDDLQARVAMRLRLP